MFIEPTITWVPSGFSGGSSIKDVRKRGRGVGPKVDKCEQGGLSQCGRPQKNIQLCMYYPTSIYK